MRPGEYASRLGGKPARSSRPTCTHSSCTELARIGHTTCAGHDPAALRKLLQAPNCKTCGTVDHRYLPCDCDCHEEPL